MSDYRYISNDFLNALSSKKGELVEFKNKVENEKDLELCFRGDAVNIYYNNQTVWKIYERKRRGCYKVEVSVHKSIDKVSRENIYAKLKKLGFTISTRTGNEQRYPYITMGKYDKGFVDATYNLLKPMIDWYFKDGKHIEKKWQQALFSELDYKKDHYYVYDLEYHEPKIPSRNLPDMLALRFEGNKPEALELVEVKSTGIACADKNSGITSHIEGMCECLKNNGFMDKRRIEAGHILREYNALGIHISPCEITNIDKNIKYGISLILTDGGALEYYTKKQKIIDSKIEKIIYNMNLGITCEIYGWIYDKKKDRYSLKSLKALSNKK